MCEWLSSAEWCDVQLVCGAEAGAGGARALRAHRAVLASASTFLKKIFLARQDDITPILVVLPDFDVETMFSVLYYVYNGEVYIAHNKMKSFLDIIRTLKIVVDENVLGKTQEPILEMDLNNRFCYLRLDASQLRSQIKFECGEGNSYVTIKKNHGSLSTAKTTDCEDRQMQCCHNNLTQKPLGKVLSLSNKDRQRKSWLRDSFIETYPQNCLANGLVSVPAMSSADYLDPTSVLLVNANDHRTPDTLNGASVKPSQSDIQLYSEKHVTNKSFAIATGFRERFMLDKHCQLQSHQKNTAINLCSSSPFALRLLSLKESNNENVNESCYAEVKRNRVNVKRINTILNAVQKNPWTPQQPICFKPFRKKYVTKLEMPNIILNDSNNNIKRHTHEDNKQIENQVEEVNTASRAKLIKCTMVFKDEESLATQSKFNPSTARFTCIECGKTFSQLRNYKYHMSVHRGTKEFAATCSVCGKYFNDRGYLSSHMKIHINRKEYKCPQCPKSFNQRVAYNMHVKIHTGVKPHVCEQCGKAFSRKMLLKQHQRTHSGERPYCCAHCGRRFADRSNMTLHLRLHTGVKPFSCTLCPKSFTKKHHLKSHLNYHTGAKPYSCPHCGLSFTQSSNMRTHMKKCVPEPERSLSGKVVTEFNGI